jgi:hypothetical protein
MLALGSYHVWSSLGAPDGLHFRLDLTQPEQRDVAREVVKVCQAGCLCGMDTMGFAGFAVGRLCQQQRHLLAAKLPRVVQLGGAVWAALPA